MCLIMRALHDQSCNCLAYLTVPLIANNRGKLLLECPTVNSLFGEMEGRIPNQLIPNKHRLYLAEKIALLKKCELVSKCCNVT